MSTTQNRSFFLHSAGRIWAENWQEPNFQAGSLLPPPPDPGRVSVATFSFIQRRLGKSSGAAQRKKTEVLPLIITKKDFHGVTIGINPYINI